MNAISLKSLVRSATRTLANPDPRCSRLPPNIANFSTMPRKRMNKGESEWDLEGPESEEFQKGESLGRVKQLEEEPYHNTAKPGEGAQVHKHDDTMRDPEPLKEHEKQEHKLSIKNPAEKRNLESKHGSNEKNEPTYAKEAKGSKDFTKKDHDSVTHTQTVS